MNHKLFKTQGPSDMPKKAWCSCGKWEIEQALADVITARFDNHLRRKQGRPLGAKDKKPRKTYDTIETKESDWINTAVDELTHG